MHNSVLMSLSLLLLAGAGCKKVTPLPAAPPPTTTTTSEQQPKLPPPGKPETRLERNAGLLRQQGIPNPEIAITKRDEDVKLPSPKEVAQKTLSWYAIAFKAAEFKKAAGEPGPKEQADKRKDIKNTIFGYIETANLKDALSSRERSFLFDVRTAADEAKDNTNFEWRYERVWVMLWVLDKRRSLGYPDKHVEKLMQEDTRSFIDKARLRSVGEILDKYDLVRRCYFAAIQAREKGEDLTGKVDEGVALEWYIALSWLVGDQDPEDLVVSRPPEDRKWQSERLLKEQNIPISTGLAVFDVGKYKITDQALANFRTDGVPEQLLTKIQPLKGNTYETAEQLVNGLTKSNVTREELTPHWLVVKRDTIDYEDSKVQLRSTEEIANRALVLFVLSLRAQALEQKNPLPPEEDTAQEFLRRQNLLQFVKPKSQEELFLYNKSPSADEIKVFKNRFDCFWLMLWALGYVEPLDMPVQEDPVTKSNRIYRARAIVLELTPDRFRKFAKLRSRAEILDKADLVYRYVYAGVEAKEKNQPMPGNLDLDMAWQWNYTLHWLIQKNNEDWENVKPDG